MSGRSFAKKERLLKEKDFSQVFKSGKRMSAGNLSVHILPNGLNTKRLGLSISSRAGGAVERNRLKRIFREFFRNNKEVFPDSSDTVISARRPAEPPGGGDIEQALREALLSAGRRKKPKAAEGPLP